MSRGALRINILKCKLLLHYKVPSCHYAVQSNSNLDSKHETSSPKQPNVLQGSKSGLIKKPEDFTELVSRWYGQYQEFVGITEILQAQDKVTKLTNDLLEAQSKRRKLQIQVDSIHQQLLTIHQRITKAELYSEDHFSLFEKARQMNTSLKDSQEQFAFSEEAERTLFTHLSTAIKFCHEKERAQAEQAKYWSLILSIVSAALASLITSVNNWVRIREIKEHSTFLHKDALNQYDTLESKIMTSISTTLANNPNGSHSRNNGCESDSVLCSEIEPNIRTVNNEIEKLISKVKGLNVGNDDDDSQGQGVWKNKRNHLAVAGVAGVLVGGLLTAAYFVLPGS